MSTSKPALLSRRSKGHGKAPQAWQVTEWLGPTRHGKAGNTQARHPPGLFIY